MKPLLLAAAILLSAFLSAPAQSKTNDPHTRDGWDFLTSSKGKNGSRVYWNQKLAGTGDDREVWLKLVPVDRAFFIRQKKLPKDYAYMTELLVLHCGVRRYTIQQSIHYDDGGHALKTIGAAARQPLAPGSLPETLYDLICRN